MLTACNYRIISHVMRCNTKINRKYSPFGAIISYPSEWIREIIQEIHLLAAIFITYEEQAQGY